MPYLPKTSVTDAVFVGRRHHMWSNHAADAIVARKNERELRELLALGAHTCHVITIDEIGPGAGHDPHGYAVICVDCDEELLSRQY